MLLTGTDNHIAGLGNMFEELADNQRGHPGYEGHLNNRVVSLSRVLKDAGYHTYMAGKWHLGLEEKDSPHAQGFEKTFALLDGGAGHFDMLPIIGPGKPHYRANGKVVEQLPADFYSSRFYVEKIIDFLKSDQGSGQPFFAYLSFTAPHWPLQAPEASIEKYHGRYGEGFDKLYTQRMQKLYDLGLLSEENAGTPAAPGEKAWVELTEQQRREEARRMEVYAAMVDDMDRYTGELIAYLKQTGQFDNTLVIFMSDNGAEGHHVDRGWDVLAEWVNACCDNRYDNIGKPDSFIWYGPNWGRVNSGPFHGYKGYVTEGGVRVPAFVYGPGVEHKGVSDSFVTVKDIMPTVLSYAGIDASALPERYAVEPMQGKSMLPFLKNQAKAVYSDEDSVGWELFAKRALRRGDWKVVLQPEPYGNGQWQLFNVKDDPSEQQDLAADYPEKYRELIKGWDRYQKENGVILPDKVSGY